MRSWEDAEDAVSLYRRLLLSSNMESVVILTIGHLSSLQRLLKSTPDQASPLSGQDLVKEKVEKWICMGGQFPEGKEANFYRPDPQSTLYCVNHWEKKVVFCGWEAGNKVITGGSRLKKTQDPGHPLYRAYELFNGFAGRQSWDQIAVLQLDCLTDKFFSFVTGHCIVNADGSNGWEDNPSGKHQYVKFNHMIDVDQVSEYIDNLMSGKEGLY